MNTKKEKNIEYPAEIIFKSIFKNIPQLHESISNILAAYNLCVTMHYKLSKNEKFISYTIQAVFPSNEVLDQVCLQISLLEGFMSMF